VRYQQASTLGLLHQQLGIPASARIFHQVTRDGPLGIYIWDLDTGNTYVMVQGHSSNPINPGRCQLPQHVKEIMAATEDDLKKLWLTSIGLDELRETVSSELAFRGINEL
jgi:hypothetical protein